MKEIINRFVYMPFLLQVLTVLGVFAPLLGMVEVSRAYRISELGITKEYLSDLIIMLVVIAPLFATAILIFKQDARAKLSAPISLLVVAISPFLFNIDLIDISRYQSELIFYLAIIVIIYLYLKFNSGINVYFTNAVDDKS